MKLSRNYIFIFSSMFFVLGLFFYNISSSYCLDGSLCTVDREYSEHPFHNLYQSIVDEYVHKGLPGLVVLIRTPEEGIWIGTGGYARLEDHTSLQSEHLFHSASACKFYTAVAVMLLKENGQIDLDAAIDKYLSNDICSRIANGHSASVRHLLSHRSGIPQVEGNPEEWNDPRNNWTWKDQLESLYDKPALFEPGAQWDYNNINYVLLALIVDNLSGDHALFFRVHIFQSLGLFNTYYRDIVEPPGLVDVYWDRYGNGYLENISSWIHQMVYIRDYGDSGIIAPIYEYARFVEGILQGDLLDEDSLIEITTPTYNEFYCLGCDIRHSPDDDLYGHAYGTRGRGKMGLVDMYYFPESDVTICYATNLGAWSVTEPNIAYEEIWDELTNAVFIERSQNNPSVYPKKKSHIKPRKIK